MVRLLTGSGFAVRHHAAILLLPSLVWEAFLWPLSSVQGGLDRPVSQKRLSLQDPKSKGTGFAQEAREPTWGGGDSMINSAILPGLEAWEGLEASLFLEPGCLPRPLAVSRPRQRPAPASAPAPGAQRSVCHQLPQVSGRWEGKGCPPQPAVLLLPIVLGQAWPRAGAGAARALWKRGKHLQTQPGFHSRHCCPTLKPNPDQRLPNTFLSPVATPELAMQPRLGFLI